MRMATSGSPNRDLLLLPHVRQYLDEADGGKLLEKGPKVILTASGLDIVLLHQRLQHFVDGMRLLDQAPDDRAHGIHTVVLAG